MQQKEERRRKGRRTEGAVGEVQLEVRGNHGNKKVIRTKLADISYSWTIMKPCNLVPARP